MKRILTGDTPTGRLHLGHFVGTLENRVKLQDEYETFIILADTHALAGQTQDSTNLNYSKVKENTLQVAMDNLAAGLDPNKVTFFIESEVPEIYELAAIFSMYVSHNRALRNPTIKKQFSAVILALIGEKDQKTTELKKIFTTGDINST